MEDDTSREDIAFWLDVLAFIELDDFRGDVTWGSASEEEVFFEVGKSSKSVVNDDRRHGSGRSKHDVFRLQIAMHDPLTVHFSHSAQQTMHEFLDFCLSEETIGLLDPMEELSSGQDLQNHIDGVFRLVDSF